MELRQLEYFAAVARHRHFTRAADELYVTQSALSQQVRRLEEELGIALLLRTSRGVEVTPAGADLLASVRDRKDAYLAQRLDRLSPGDLAALDRAAGILERVLEEGAE